MNVDARGARRVLVVALTLNAMVAAAKILCGRAADVFAIEADGYHSLTDGLGSLVALVGLSLSMRPADRRHPYGHRKFEILAASIIGVGLLVVAAGVVRSVLEAGPSHPRIGALEFGVLLVTLAINFALSRYQAREGRRLRSAVLVSDARHTRSDCYVTAGVLLTTSLTAAGLSGFDLVAAIAVAGLVAKAGVDILRENLGYLTDASIVEPDAVAEVASGIAPVIAATQVRTRGTPGAVFMDLRLELPGSMSFRDVSEVVERVREAIRYEFTDVVDVVVQPMLRSTFEDAQGALLPAAVDAVSGTYQRASRPVRVERREGALVVAKAGSGVDGVEHRAPLGAAPLG